jgi:hypothetical protein
MTKVRFTFLLIIVGETTQPLVAAMPRKVIRPFPRVRICVDSLAEHETRIVRVDPQHGDGVTPKEPEKKRIAVRDFNRSQEVS